MAEQAAHISREAAETFDQERLNMEQQQQPSAQQPAAAETCDRERLNMEHKPAYNYVTAGRGADGKAERYFSNGGWFPLMCCACLFHMLGWLMAKR